MNKLMFAIGLATLIVGLNGICQADQSFTVNGKPGSKLDALRALIKDQNAKVVRCQEVTMSDKGTIVNKKVVKADSK